MAIIAHAPRWGVKPFLARPLKPGKLESGPPTRRSRERDCKFETALERAVRRGQEGLSPEETVRAFESIYFPAQRIHFALDRQRDGATTVIVNDARIATQVA